jgi:hypothetical protein
MFRIEKTYFGWRVEINLQQALGFADGEVMDLAIPDAATCKFLRIPGLKILHESIGGFCSPFGRATPATGTSGLIRATGEVLMFVSGDQDQKPRLAPLGKSPVMRLP